MIVKELIEQLKKENPNSSVVKNTKIMLYEGDEGELLTNYDEQIEPVTEIKYDCIKQAVVIL